MNKEENSVKNFILQRKNAYETLIHQMAIEK